MGKRIIARARGKGGSQYRAPSHRYVGKVGYVSSQFIDKTSKGVVKDIIHDPARNAPLAIIKFDGLKEETFQVAPKGLYVGQDIIYDGDSDIGNVLKLKDVPIGTKISAIENRPNSGPKMCRSSGSFATVTSKSEGKVVVKFPSGKSKSLNDSCRATIGVPAGGGRLEKPWVKAGKKHHALRARGKLYPRTSGVAMTATDHPYGGQRKAPRPSGTVGRNAPPGAKVGSIAARRMGKRKGKKRK